MTKITTGIKCYISSTLLLFTLMSIMTTVESHRVTTKEITVNYFPPEELHENYDKSKKREKIIR